MSDREPTLPPDIWKSIFSYISSIKELASISQVSKQFQDWSEDDTLWKPLFIAKFPVNSTREGQRGWKILYKDFYLRPAEMYRNWGDRKDHKLCVHSEEDPHVTFFKKGDCHPDPFWMNVYHNGKPFVEFIDAVHRGINVKQLDCALFGDINTTSLLISLRSMYYNKEQQAPSKIYKAYITVDDTIFCLHFLSDITETKKCDIAIYCFNLSDSRTFESLEKKWLIETNDYLKNDAVKLIVGTGIEKEGSVPLLNYRRGYELARSLGAGYRECSTVNCTGVAGLFLEVCRMKLPKKFNFPTLLTENTEKEKKKGKRFSLAFWR